MHAAKKQSGQVMVIVAVWLIALIGSAALILLTGSVEWQRNQSQQLADQAALDAALKIGVGCTAGSASTVITEADNFVATQRTRTGALTIGAGTCSGGYAGTDTFAGGLSETIHYPYRGHQQQVEVILTVSLPISFGSYMGASNTNVTRRAVAQQLNGDMPAVSATSLACTGGQFNVGGSVVAANAITLSGGCAIYAHQRLDAASSTYSDLGDTSVYANGQSWVGGGGLCVAGANTGSTNSVCADGYEVSGHNATTCGASGTSAFLSAGNAAINANPCAAGTGPQPVAPVSTALPPEPNTDPAAIATLRNNAGGPLGAACNAAGVYPNITAGGTVVGTGLGPSPASADASGFYHFKPSCYGYLNLSTMAGGISARQIGAESARQRHFITATMPAASQAGTLLVATVSAETTPNKFAATAGWVSASEANQAGEGRSEIWYYPNNPGGINSVTFTMNPATVNGNAQLSEWTGVAVASPLDQSGSQAVAVPTTTTTVSTGGALTQTGELVITIDGFQNLPGQTFSRGAGWTGAVTDIANGYSSEYRLDLPTGVASETLTAGVASLWANAIATFKPAGGGGGAVLDPGFYFFNGSGFAGGGGICLNGGELLARDTTLEFVNQAGFSTGTCAPGGGASCAAATCQFGSTPCSISACPPNLAADSAGGGYTWFAAPCAQAPSGDASCPGSSWCPVGDRACWNLLVWAPASNTGQIAIQGTSARHWMLGSVYWPGTCTDTVNGSSTIDGTISCGTLSVAAAAGAGTAVGGDYGINTALVEAILVE
ncbi:MAG: hypothetical protein E6I05_09965 [Chloroflexi bacterium]|nr:MAG: hypothetical protein E6I05_09965 [Chloroflexota bacterium]